MSFYVDVHKAGDINGFPHYRFRAENLIVIDENPESEDFAVLLKLSAEDYKCFSGGNNLKSKIRSLLGHDEALLRDEIAPLYTVQLSNLGINDYWAKHLRKASIDSLGDIIAHDMNYYLTKTSLKRTDFVELVNYVAVWLKHNFHLDVVVWHRVQRILLDLPESMNR